MTRNEHLLTILAEECAEVIQRISKTLRFGTCEVQPGQSDDNTTRMVNEVIDLLAAYHLLHREGNGCLPPLSVLIQTQAFRDKQAKVEKFLELSRSEGTLE